MNRIKGSFLWYFFMVFLSTVVMLGVSSVTSADDLAAQASSEDLFRKAGSLKEDGNYDAAYAILKKLADENSGNNAYQIGYIDALLEQSRTMKETGNPDWKTKAKEAGYKIKILQPANASNADFYLVYAKYSWLVETKRDAHIHKALERAFHFKPGYVEAFILKGDIHSDLARTAPTEAPQDTTTMTGGSSYATRHLMAMTAREAYLSALSAVDISSRKKAYVYFRLGELEDQLMGNKADARTYWEKSAALWPDSKTGRLAKMRMGK
jgi:tetratricopeptide (TPR) repeat protein